MDHLANIFTVEEMIDISHAARERGVNYRDLVRQAVLADLVK